MRTLRYFYDVPVYRLPREQYYAKRNAHADSILFQVGTPCEATLRRRDKENPRANDALREHLEQAYGGC